MIQNNLEIRIAIVSGISALIGGIIVALFSNILDKNNQIETRVYELKIQAYQEIYKEVNRVFDKKNMIEEYNRIYSETIKNEDFKNCGLITASECLKNKPENQKLELKTIQAEIKNYIMGTYVDRALNILKPYSPIFPYKSFQKIKYALFLPYQNIQYQVKSCKEGHEVIESDCFIDPIQIEDFGLLILETLTKDIQSHY